MKSTKLVHFIAFTCTLALAGCNSKTPQATPEATKASEPTPVYFHVDPDSAGSVKGSIHLSGKRPKPAVIDMSGDPACVEAHHGKAYDESVMVSPNGSLGNAFIYIKQGLEGKNFDIPATPVTIDQKGCWFHPRIMGIQVGQVLQVVNSDPVTHNIHPMAEINREWNHSQGPGDEPLSRKFTKPEVMVPVKCNIHSWMHAFIGVVSNPYFAVSKEDGTFEIKNLPAGTYTLAVWQEKLGVQEQQITVKPQTATTADFTLKGK